jgi:DNA-binding NarL/FixJ family response regulator
MSLASSTTSLPSAETGRELYISETTVKTTHVLQKLGLRDRVQAVVLADQAGRFERALDE